MITRLIAFGLVFVLSSCVAIKVKDADIRHLPGELKATLSRGDTRQKVRSVLGEPLVYSQSLGVEVYQASGEDLYFPLRVDYPVHAATLVTYDDNELVEELATGLWQLNSDVDVFRITASGFSVVNVSRFVPPETLLAPPVHWESLTAEQANKDECMLVLLMGQFPMEAISLDGEEIADLSPAGSYVYEFEGMPEFPHYVYIEHMEKLIYIHERSSVDMRNLSKAFIQRAIPPGVHTLSVRVTSSADLETMFECKRGEAVYAELSVKAARLTKKPLPKVIIDGSIVLSKSPPDSMIQMTELQAILWHNGAWIDSYKGSTTH